MKKQIFTDDELWGLVNRLARLYIPVVRKALDWKKIHEDWAVNKEERDGDIICSSYMGTVFQIMPSGKYWTIWADGNMTVREQIMDTAFTCAMEKVSSEAGCWIENSENDPCDLMICKIGLPEKKESFSKKMKWIPTDGWRGYEQPEQAVCGANDTGGHPDSPCPSKVRQSEIAAVKQQLRKAGIRFRTLWGDSSNVFNLHCYLICLPSEQKRAREIVQRYLDENETRLLYVC